MALLFPSSPTNGQTYTYSGVTYTYDGARWIAKTNTISQASTTVNISNVAPSNPATGQMWLNSDTATISVYALGGWVSVGSINSSINVGSITGTMIAGNTITAADIANSAITTRHVTDGSITSSKLAAGLVVPTQTGNYGKYLTTDGVTASWASVPVIPTQTANSGKYLTTNGTTASWATVSPGTSNARNIINSYVFGH